MTAGSAPASIVLDASALLAYLHDEPGGDMVGAELERACMSSVNWAEVYQKAIAREVDTRGLRQDMEALGLQLLAFNPALAETSAALWSVTRPYGLSLADRACLALAQELGKPVLTADRAWLEVPFEGHIDIRVIR